MTSEPLTRDRVVRAWLERGLEDLFLSFQLDAPFNRYGPFMNAMGLELICKGYLIGTKSEEYTQLPYDQGIKKIEEIAKSFSHKLSKLVCTILGIKPNGHLRLLLDMDFDGFSGDELLEALRAAYIECRYPFPIQPSYLKHKDPDPHSIYRDPLWSSGLAKFCWAVTREILAYTNEDFAIEVDRAYIFNLLGSDEQLYKFCNLLILDSDARQKYELTLSSDPCS